MLFTQRKVKVMPGRLFARTLAAIAFTYLNLASMAHAVTPTDIDLSLYGFKGVPSRNFLEGLVIRPLCLFLDNDHIVLVNHVRGTPKGLATRDQPDSLRLHYLGVVISLNSKKVVSTVDLGGADYNTAVDVLSNGILVFYRHGAIDFWKLGSDEILRKKQTISLDVHEIDEAMAAPIRQFLEVSLLPSYSHNTLYLYLNAGISMRTKLWKITSGKIESLDTILPRFFLEEAAESEVSMLGLKNWDECRFFVIADQGRTQPYEIYHQSSCQHQSMPSFLGPHEIVFTSAIKPPEFRTETGEVISHPGVGNVGKLAAAWDGSAYLGVALSSSGGIEALDISAHTSKATMAVFDNKWHERCRLLMKVRGADLSGPYLSPKGDRIVAYDKGHFYIWDLNQEQR
jgi:hypothetical protein